MPSQPRYAIIDDNSIFHVTWQCHNLEWHLKEDWTKQLYYNLLLEHKDQYGVQIFSYCFMSNHPHLTGVCRERKRFSDFFRIVNSRFAKQYNREMKRRGQLVMDRFKSPKIQTEQDLFKVMLYVDLNPKRAGMVQHPKDYKWSSYAYYAHGKKDPLITEPTCYTDLGISSEQRQEAYRSMIEDILRDDWKQKKPYSSFPFIGDPEWVEKRYMRLKNIMKKMKVQKLLAPPD